MNNLHKVCLVLCQLLLKGCLSFMKEGKTKSLHIGETDGGQGETERPIQIKLPWKMGVAMEIKKRSNLLVSPETVAPLQTPQQKTTPVRSET